MSLVKAKKHLGQHFLTDKKIAEKIGEISISGGGNFIGQLKEIFVK